MRRSLLPLAILFFVPLIIRAAALININTADLAALETLDGIGPSKAQAIIDYRTQNGPFAAIEDIMNVSGIGTATYDNIKSSITVSGASSDAGQTQTQQSQTQSDAQAPQTASGGPTMPALTARIAADTPAIAGAGTLFDGSLFDAGGEPITTGARYLWNFGDGGTAEGARVLHTYRYPGEYEAVLSVGYDYQSATARLVVPVSAAQVSLAVEGDGSLTVYNLSASDLDIGLWSLGQATSTFAIPEGTMALAGKGVRFAPEVLGFSGGMAAALYYPNGAEAIGAAAGEHSPLRGEVVDAPEQAAPAPAASKSAAPRADTAAAGSSSPALVHGAEAAAAGLADISWTYLLALAGLIAVGAAGAYYARTPVSASSETELTADEFEIE